MSSDSLMQELAKNLAKEYIPVALAGTGIPAPVTRVVLETMILTLEEQQNTTDKHLRKLVGSYYKSGADYLADARNLQGERREQWIQNALSQFVTASHVEDTFLAAKSQFFVGVCYELLNEYQLARQWYERAYRSVVQYAARSQYDQQLRQFIQVLLPVLFAHGSTISSTQPISNRQLFYFDQGMALAELERGQEALAAFEQAIRLDPNFAGAHEYKGRVLGGLGRYQEALAIFEQVLRLAPNSAGAYDGKGMTLDELGRYQEALAALEQAIRLDPNFAGAYNNKGMVLIRLKRYREALQAIEQALRLDPNFAHAYNNKGEALEGLGRNNEAQQFYEKARQLGYK